MDRRPARIRHKGMDNSSNMDMVNGNNLTARERIELQARIQRLGWLLGECIRMEEYGLCAQIRDIINRNMEKLSLNSRENITE